jgi:hypothetical protein
MARLLYCFWREHFQGHASHRNVVILKEVEVNLKALPIYKLFLVLRRKLKAGYECNK